MTMQMLEVLMGGDFPLDDGHERDEANWARNHAARWAEHFGLDEEDVYGFAEYFTSGWLDHLKTNFQDLEAQFRQMIRLYEEDKKNG